MKIFVILFLLTCTPLPVLGQHIYYFNAYDTTHIQFSFDTTLVFYGGEGNKLPTYSELLKDTTLNAFEFASKVLIRGVLKKPGRYVIYAGNVKKEVYILLVFEVDSALKIKILSHREFDDYDITNPADIHFVESEELPER